MISGSADRMRATGTTEGTGNSVGDGSRKTGPITDHGMTNKREINKRIGLSEL
jgi:hypothetical protein